MFGIIFKYFRGKKGSLKMNFAFCILVVLVCPESPISGAFGNEGKSDVITKLMNLSAEDGNETKTTIYVKPLDWNSLRNNRIRPLPTEITDTPEDAFTTEIGITLISQHVCNPDQVYDSAIHGCRRNCSGEETYYDAIQQCVPSKDYLKLRRRPLCKNMTIPNTEFIMDSTGVLIIKEPNVTFAVDAYTNVSNGISACYPFSVEFIKCKRWGLEPGEYELRNDGFNMWVPAYSKLYNPGDFMMVNSTQLLAVICVRKVPPSGKALEYAQVLDMYAAAWTISAVCMLISIIIYLFTQQLKYHTKTLICHMISLLVFYIVLIIRAWAPPPKTPICISFAILLNVTFLASFFWLNVLAYDIWKRLPNYHPQGLNPRAGCPVFLWASLYAWGLPVILAGSAVAVNYLTPEDNPLNPNFKKICWLESQYSRLLFMYGPAALLLAANFIFFVLTVVNLRSIGRDAALVNRRIHKQLFKMYLKLMVVMGLCWTMEIVSALVGKSNRYWYFTDMVNCLQGFFIFLIYVCKRSILKDIIQKWEKRCGPCICRKLGGVIFSTRAHIHPNHHRHAGRDNSSSASIFASSDCGMNSTSSTRISTTSTAVN